MSAIIIKLLGWVGLKGFELSFPRNNSQGVSFGLWHRRYREPQSAQQIVAVTQKKTVSYLYLRQN